LAVDHDDAFCVGIHAGRIGNRFAALQPIAQGLKAEFGATGADAGRGLILRMDNGTQYTADDFLNPVKFWGITPSFAFVAEPQPNGVAERFNRTLKEQAIHGRISKNVEEVRAAVTAFRDRDNRHWRLEKLGFMSPLEARQAYAMRKAA
jgi:transposase InsO family protein